MERRVRCKREKISWHGVGLKKRESMLSGVYGFSEKKKKMEYSFLERIFSFLGPWNIPFSL